MLASFFWICAFNLLYIKNGVRAQTSACPNYFMYQFDGTKIEGIITVPGFRGINDLQVQIVFLGEFDKNNVVTIELADGEQVARNSYKNGGNVRYKIKFPEKLNNIPRILSIKLNNQQYCNNNNAIIPNEAYTTVGLNFKVNAGGSNTPQHTTAQPAQPAQLIQPVQPFQPIWPVQPIKEIKPVKPVPPPIEPDFSEDIDFSSIPPASPSYSLSPVSNRVSSPSDRDWLKNYKFNNECGMQYTAVHTIVNGRDVVENEFPWLVALFNHKRIYFCGGSLISDKHVITAAHCCVQQNWIFLEFGKHNLADVKETGVARRVSSQIINHPEYKPQTGHADIALITFEEPVTFSNKIKPICLWPFPTHSIGTNGTVAGWGNDISGSPTNTPMAADVDIVSDQECVQSHKLFQSITSKTTFCAGGKNKGPCQGDSGAGLIIYEDGRWYLKGVISVSLSSNPRGGFCDVNKFAVYCDVAKYLGWLREYLI